MVTTEHHGVDAAGVELVGNVLGVLHRDAPCDRWDAWADLLVLVDGIPDQLRLIDHGGELVGLVVAHRLLDA
ncbi:hypothetical protein D3C87_2151420 [compost metagenome]